MPDALLNLVVIRAADLERSARFYRRLGLEFIQHRHGSGPEHLAAEMGGTAFEIYPRRNEQDTPGGLRLGFRVPALDAVLTALTEAGAPLVSAAKESPWGRRAVVDDPDGYRVELTEAMPAGQGSEGV